MARVVYDRSLLAPRVAAPNPSYRDRGMETVGKGLALANDIASSPLTSLAIRGIDKGVNWLSDAAARSALEGMRGADADLMGAGELAAAGDALSAASAAGATTDAPVAFGAPQNAPALAARRSGLASPIGRDTSGETHWGVIEQGKFLPEYQGEGGVSPAMRLEGGPEYDEMRAAMTRGVADRAGSQSMDVLANVARRRAGLADREAAAEAEWQAIQPAVLAEVNDRPFPTPNAATDWMQKRGVEAAARAATPAAVLGGFRTPSAAGLDTASMTPGAPSSAPVPSGDGSTVAPPSPSAPAATETASTSPTSPAGRLTLRTATDEQLRGVRAKLEAAAAKGDARSVETLALLDKELGYRAAKANSDANGPVDLDQLMVEASAANTPEAQAAVWEKAKRVHAPLTNLTDLFTSAPMDRVTNALRAKMPGTGTAADDMLKEQRAEWYRERAKTEAELRDPEKNKRNAAADASRGAAAAAQAKAKDTLARIEGEVKKTAAEQAELESKTKERNALLEGHKKKLYEEVSALAKRNARRTGRGGGTGYSKDDVKWAADADDKAAAREKLFDASLKSAEDAAARQTEIAQRAIDTAERAAADVGDPPEAPTFDKYVDPAVKVRAESDHRRQLAEYNRRAGIADAARKSAELAQQRAQEAEKKREEANTARQEAAKLGDDERRVAAEIRQYGIAGFRKRQADRAKQGGQPPATAPATPTAPTARMKAPEGAKPGSTIRQKSTGRTFRVGADGFMEAV